MSRSITPLLWADPGFEIVQRIRRAAERAVPNHGAPSRNYRQRKIAEEFARRLEAAGILVETA